jgi:hypothetical protein
VTTTAHIPTTEERTLLRAVTSEALHGKRTEREQVDALLSLVDLVLTASQQDDKVGVLVRLLGGVLTASQEDPEATLELVLSALTDVRSA